MSAARRERDERLVRFRRARKQKDVQYLLKSLADIDLRGRAALELGRLGVREAIGPITALLGANDPLVRSYAVSGLCDLDARELLPRFVEIARADPVWFVRSWAIDAIGRLGSDDHVAVLVDLLGDPEPQIRWAVAIGLARLGDPGAIGALERAAQRESWLGRRRFRKEIHKLRSH